MTSAHDLPALPRDDLALASRLRNAVTRLNRRLRGERPELGPSLTLLAALATLERHGPLTPRALADHERVRPPSMSRVLASLEQEGLVDRNPHPTDGRQYLVSATPRAIRMLEDDRRRRDAWLARRLAELTPAERATLHDAAQILDRVTGS